MTHVCRQCSRINPSEAAFCYWDGAILSGMGSGPINAGSAPFRSHFIFPGGQICRNFDQLATTCQANWKAAVDLLKQGFFASFLGGLGRADLARAAAEAAKYPDADRGLDQLLEKLPTQVLERPKVKVEPSVISLGVLPMGADRNLELHLSNQGMRLAFGSVVSDCKWLTFGEGQGSAQKLFQFGAEAVIAVHVKGQFLRAGNQPLEGHLVVDSNGGTTTVTVRADVPITPFSEGALAGSFTPRQIAEKARAHPKEAAALFEKGLVAKWFTRNGWTYPVQGPSVAGLGGVQQFFEALGLAKPPKVALKTASLQVTGDPGQVLTAALEVSTLEKKHVFAFAVSDKPWAIPGSQPKHNKTPTLVILPLTIKVPGTPGQVQQAKITVTANGNQKFTVPVTLTVSGKQGDYVPIQAILLPAEAAMGGAMPIMATPIDHRVRTAPGPRLAGKNISADVVSDTPFDFQLSSAPPNAVAAGAPPLLASAPAQTEALINVASKSGSSYRKKSGHPLRLHLVPMGLLALLLVIVMIRDLIGRPSGTGNSIDSADVDRTPRLAVFFDYGNEAHIGNTVNFGLVAIDPQNPKDPNPQRLTYDFRGRTNSTVVLIDNVDKVFGMAPMAGKWIGTPACARDSGLAEFQFTPEPIFVTQTVQIIPGEAYETAAGTGIFKRPLNTCLIKYKIENKDARTHKIGLRVMIDTLIGQNDGVPFTIPGVPGLVATSKDFRGQAEIPDFIQALEYADLDNPGTVVQMNLKLSDKLAPDRVSLTHWPGPNFAGWDVRMDNIRDDSCIALYWEPVEVRPGKDRDLAFSYGLGNLKGGKLGLTIGGTLAVNREMTVIAYVADPQPGEQATLELPKGFELIGGSAAKQPVPPAERGANGKQRPSPITWRVRPTVDGRHTLTVKTSTELSVSQQVTIRKKGIF